MKRHWKIFITLVVVLPIVPVLWMAMMQSEGRSDVNHYRNSLIAKGEKFEIADLLPPPVPPDQNGADLVDQAAGRILVGTDSNTPVIMRFIVPGKAMVSFQQPDIRDEHFTNSWSNVMAFLPYNRPATELLRQATAYPAFDYHIDYRHWDSGRWNHRLVAPQCMQSLLAEVAYDLHNGDAAPATTNICAMLALVNGQRDAESIFSQEECCKDSFGAVRASWELLQSPNVTEADLAMLQKYWERLEFVNAMARAFAMNRAITEATIQKMRVSDAYFVTAVGWERDWDFSGDLNEKWQALKDHSAKAYAKSMWYSSWSYPDELRMLQNEQMALETFRTIQTNGYFYPAYPDLLNRLQAIQKSQGETEWEGFKWMFSFTSEGLGGATLQITLKAEAARQLVMAAIALKRYQLKYGSYPPALAAVAPEFAATVPRDPIDGKPLRYRLNADGSFLLYCIGTNGKDDGGDATDPVMPIVHGADFNWAYPRWLNYTALDWVWPQPATEAEVEAYYGHAP